MRALDLKLLRDLWRMRGQALAIALVLAAATSTFVLSMGVSRSLAETRDAYYARNHYADVFVEMTRAPRSVVDRIAAIEGVQQVEGRIQQYASLDMPGRVIPVRALINSIDEHGYNRLNLITLREGRLPRAGAPQEVVVDEAFAQASSLAVGDEVSALIYGSRQPLRIVGVGLAPDFIYSLAPGDLVPDNTRFGIFWMGEEALEAATDRKEAINSISLTLQRGVSEAEVIRKVDDIVAPYGGAGAYGREDHISNAFVDNELMQLDAMTQVIPPVFLVVATFLVYIVLGRLIRTERTQIGLIKAFGYSDWAIAAHYLKFSLVVAGLATLGGSLAGIWMGRAMTELYLEFFRFPFLEYRVSGNVFLGAALLSFGAAGLGALGGMRTAARLNPAVAMSPPPPPVYRSGMLEKFGTWGGFSAIGHMIARHIARWPWRSAITVLGVSLSLALLFATLQFMDSSRTMLDSYFFRAQRQDMTVTFTEPRNEDVLYELEQLPGVLRAEPVRGVPVKLSFTNRMERTAIESTSEDAVLSARIDADGNELGLPPAGLMLSRRMADKLGVDAGDSIHVELLGGRQTELDLNVAGIVDEFIGERAYATQGVLERLTRDAAPVGAAQLRIDPAERDRILTELKDMPLVLGVTERDAAMERFEELIDENINTMLVFYIAFASAIAVGVVYNSARILFSERAHELATLRVLGYFRSEVGIVMLGELALLVVAAVPVGCILGYWLAQFMTAMFSSDLFRLPFAPSRSTYGFASLVVMASASLTAVVVAMRVFKLDMVRVLKAQE
ncbi:ABC transporter permease [Aurantiacibacter sp. MUD11]|uniref:ABC transporter permease n=1 Tax=Aurantiacibacter sp. MUD11 TaxID=3003265 RepID=UPI0022AB1C5D|nr:FtsX-like permease family protein [Aurantiacibacter sp. MUD11]WAT18607.1 ABC transporter permease [Aurantiacibacter sp. MUD11]